MLDEFVGGKQEGEDRSWDLSDTAALIGMMIEGDNSKATFAPPGTTSLRAIAIVGSVIHFLAVSGKAANLLNYRDVTKEGYLIY